MRKRLNTPRGVALAMSLVAALALCASIAASYAYFYRAPLVLVCVPAPGGVIVCMELEMGKPGLAPARPEDNPGLVPQKERM